MSNNNDLAYIDIRRNTLRFCVNERLNQERAIGLGFRVTRQAHLAGSVWLGRCRPTLVVPLRLLIKGDLQTHSETCSRNTPNSRFVVYIVFFMSMCWGSKIQDSLVCMCMYALSELHCMCMHSVEKRVAYRKDRKSSSLFHDT